MSKKSHSSTIDPIVARARSLKPAARAEFLRQHSMSEITAIHERVIGTPKPRTPRPVMEKRILAALAGPMSADPGSAPRVDLVTRSFLSGPYVQAAAKEDPPSAAPEPEPEVHSPERAAEPEPDPLEGARSAEGAAEPPESGADDMAKPEPEAAERELPPVGTVIIKSDRRGKERARCEIVEGGVLYAGNKHTSLSAAAIAAAHDLGLTSKTLNGWAWWGLAKPPRTGAPRRDAAAALGELFSRYLDKAAAALADAPTEDRRSQLRDAIQQHLASHTALAGERGEGDADRS